MRFILILSFSIISHAIVLTTRGTRSNNHEVNPNSISRTLYLKLVKENKPASREEIENSIQVQKKKKKFKNIEKVFYLNERPYKNEPTQKKKISSFRALQKESKPNLLINPEYPKIAQRLGLEGSVKYDVYVDQNGQFFKSKANRKLGHEILDENAKRTIMESKYSNKGKLDVVLTLTVKYIL